MRMLCCSPGGVDELHAPFVCYPRGLHHSCHFLPGCGYGSVMGPQSMCAWATPTPPVPVPPVSGSDAAWCPVRSSILFTPPARSFCQGCARYVPIRLTSPSPSSILFSMTYEESACKNMKAKYLYSAYKETKDLSRISPKCKEGRSSFELCPYF